MQGDTHTRPIPSCRFVWERERDTNYTTVLWPGDDSFHSWLRYSSRVPFPGWRAESLDRIVLDRGMACSRYPAYMAVLTLSLPAVPSAAIYHLLLRSLGPLVSIWGRVQLGVQFSTFFFFFSFFDLCFCSVLVVSCFFCCLNIFYLLSYFRSDASCSILRMQSADLVSQRWWFV